MPEENFSTLIPQQGDPPEVLRMKLGVAAARLASAFGDGVAVDLAAVKSGVEALVSCGFGSVANDLGLLRTSVDTLLSLAQQLVPLPVIPRCWQFHRTADPQPLINTPTYFRKGYFYGSTLEGVANVLPVRLYYGDNGNRVLLPGQVVLFEAGPGQVFDLENFSMAGGYFYAECVSVELY